MIKHYPSLTALLIGEFGDRAPSPAAIGKLAAHIRSQHPHATHLIYFKNGHWTLLPAGPGEALQSPEQAEEYSVPPRRRARAYCEF